MKHGKMALVALAICILCSCHTQQASDKFHGMWQLDKFEAYHNGTKTWAPDSSRVGWSGYIIYDGLGHMAVHLMPKGYKEFDTKKNMDSLQRDSLMALANFYKSNFVYFADYTLTDSTVAHKRLSTTEPANFGTTLVRDFNFINDTLILTAHEKIGGQKVRLRWIRLK